MARQRTVSELGYEDAFGTFIADGTTNKADIASHYPFSPERWRVFVDGARQFVQYGSVSQFNDLADAHELIPGQGEVVTMRTTEKFRYPVGYVLEASMAYAVSRSLESGDKVVIGLGDADLENDMASADGWFYVYTPDLADDEVSLEEWRAGTKVASETVKAEKALTVWKRMQTRMNWYNVGATIFSETYTRTGLQFNDELHRLSVDEGKGPESGNQHISFSVKRGASSSSLTLETGSVAVKLLGSVSQINKNKTGVMSASIGSADTWVPVGALRLDPDRDNVVAEIKSLELGEFDGNADAHVMASVVASSKTDAATWSTPESHSEKNSVIEEAATITTFPDSTGAVGSSANNPGGYQLAFDSLYTGGSGNKTSLAVNPSVEKRIIPSGDVLVFLAKAGATGNIKFNYTIEEDW